MSEEKYYLAATPDTGIPTRLKISRKGPPRVTGVLHQADVDAWHATTLAGLSTTHECAEGHRRPGDEACPAQVRFVSSAADEFMRTHLPAEKWAAVTEDKSLASRSASLWALSFVFATPLLYVMYRLFMDMAANRATTTVPGLLLLGAFISGLFSIGAASSAQETPVGSGFFRAALWLRTAPVSGLLRLLAKALARAHANRVRWFAVSLALVGFGLDLFAS